jgi:hypothetical protein
VNGPLPIGYKLVDGTSKNNLDSLVRNARTRAA